MGSRTLPYECQHGTTIDYGDFGPCQDCSEHEGAPCPNFVDCERCEAEGREQRAIDREEAKRLIAEFQHRNESLHRHPDVGKKSCSYCDLVGMYALAALDQAGFDVVRRQP
jgi:hypothetical protein